MNNINVVCSYDHLLRILTDRKIGETVIEDTYIAISKTMAIPYDLYGLSIYVLDACSNDIKDLISYKIIENSIIIFPYKVSV